MKVSMISEVPAVMQMNTATDDNVEESDWSRC